jgi:hypothetical protein
MNKNFSSPPRCGELLSIIRFKFVKNTWKSTRGGFYTIALLRSIYHRGDEFGDPIHKLFYVRDEIMLTQSPQIGYSVGNTVTSSEWFNGSVRLLKGHIPQAIF